MYKRGFDRTSLILILVGAIIVFGIVTSGVLYSAFKTGTILGYNLTVMGNDTSTPQTNNSSPRTPTALGSCSFGVAYWAQNDTSVLWTQQGQVVDLTLESNACEGVYVNVTVFKRANGTDSPVEQRSILLDRTYLFSFRVDSNVGNDTLYYFTATQSDNATVFTTSSLLGINNPPNVLYFDPSFCNGFNDDVAYLYNVSTSVFTRGDGKESFTVSFNGTMLRTNGSSEGFYIDHSNGALSIQYDIVPSCGGVDVTYTIRNPTSQPQQLPDFQIDGINQPRTNAKYLNVLQWGALTNVPSGNVVLYQYPYPYGVVYSPVMVAVNNNLSIGSSFEYPYMQYRRGVQPLLFWNSDGTARYVYNMAYSVQNTPPQSGIITPGGVESYTITLRFSSTRNWLLTLDPYKKYFNSLYNSIRSSRPRDLRPVSGFGVSDPSWINGSNPRGYVEDNFDVTPYKRSRIDLHGWKNTTDWILGIDSPLGYKRIMIWLPSGSFSETGPCGGCNFPPQFMDWPGIVGFTASELLRVKDAGMSLGYWWGHAGRVPVPNTWPPTSLKIANYSDPNDRAFLEGQLDLAYQRGADEIGLDALTEMEPYDRYYWIDEMKQRAPGVNFIHEIAGPDFLHTKIPNFYSDTYDLTTRSWGYIGGPHLISWYLNPQSEIWILTALSPAQFHAVGETQGMTARAHELTGWGDTYVDSAGVNVTNWDTHVSQCLDGIDNDNDGKVDWPRDPGCASEFDLTED